MANTDAPCGVRKRNPAAPAAKQARPSGLVNNDMSTLLIAFRTFQIVPPIIPRIIQIPPLSDFFILQCALDCTKH